MSAPSLKDFLQRNLIENELKSFAATIGGDEPSAPPSPRPADPASSAEEDDHLEAEKAVFSTAKAMLEALCEFVCSQEDDNSDYSQIAAKSQELCQLLDQHLASYAGSDVAAAPTFPGIPVTPPSAPIVGEASLTPAQKKKREEIVMGMKKNKAELQRKYGDDWESVMYATATKQALGG